MKSKLHASRQGFTIVEVMIVLAVTGVLFLSVVLVISGKQQGTEFQTALNDLRAQLQQIGNEVGSGYYPNSNYRCTATTTPAMITLASTPGSDSGTCVFLGKALHFSNSGGGANDTLSAFTVAGIQTDPISYANALLVAPVPNSSFYHSNNSGTPPVDVTANSELEYGLSAATMTYNDGAASHPLGSFAFVQSINTLADAGGSSQHLAVMGFTHDTAAPFSAPLDEADTLDNAFANGYYELNDPITICFNSGTTNQSGTMTINPGDSNLDIATQIQNGSC